MIDQQGPGSEGSQAELEGMAGHEEKQVVADARQVLVRFRKAGLLVSDTQEFRTGIACGQATLAGKQAVSEEELFELVEDLLRDLEISKPRLVGCVAGMVDALLQARKLLPPEFAALLRPVQ